MDPNSGTAVEQCSAHDASKIKQQSTPSKKKTIDLLLDERNTTTQMHQQTLVANQIMSGIAR